MVFILIEQTGTLNVKKISTFNYMVNLTNNYEEKTNQLFPVILFLHGIGERGNDISNVKKYGIHKYLDVIDIPFVIISPQCHFSNFWETHTNDIELKIHY